MLHCEGLRTQRGAATCSAEMFSELCTAAGRSLNLLSSWIHAGFPQSWSRALLWAMSGSPVLAELIWKSLYLSARAELGGLAFIQSRPLAPLRLLNNYSPIRSEGSSATVRGKGSPPRAWAQCAASTSFSVALQVIFLLDLYAEEFPWWLQSVEITCKGCAAPCCGKSLCFLVVSLLEYICNYLDYAIMKLLWYESWHGFKLILGLCWKR